jgi:amidase
MVWQEASRETGRSCGRPFPSFSTRPRRYRRSVGQDDRAAQASKGRTMVGRLSLLALVFVVGVAVASLMPGVPQTLRKMVGLALEPSPAQSQRHPRDEAGNRREEKPAVVKLTDEQVTEAHIEVATVEPAILARRIIVPGAIIPVMCSLCEETGQSCRGPANHNSVALILPHKAHLSFLGGAIGAEIYNDRAGITCRAVTDAVRVLDALKDSVEGYYDRRDIFTTVPRSSISTEPYASAITSGSAGALKGMRIGIIREFMVKHAKVDEPIVDAVAAEMKAMLNGHLGATLVESVTPGWVDDPEVENMTTSFDRAIAELVPVLYPDLLYRLNAAREPVYPAFAAKVRPTPFAPGVIKGTGTMAPADWMVRWAEGIEPSPPNLTLRDLLGGGGDTGSRTFRFHIPQYLTRRAKDWADRGFKETLVDWPSLNARSKFWGDDQRAAFKNWEDITSLHSPPKGIAENIQRRELLRRVMMKVMHENKLDVLIQLHTALPPGKIGLAPEPVINSRIISYPFGPNAGITEILIPAGYVRTAYDPKFELATDANGRKFYRSVTGTVPTEIPIPGLPFSINFLVEPGMEHLALKAATAYQAASQRRVPPPMFPSLPGEP